MILAAKNKGFSLLETLVALSILAISLLSAFRALSVSTQSTYAITEAMIGDWVAENRLNELRAFKIWPEPGNTQGIVIQAGKNYTWRQETVSTQNPLIRRVNIAVFNPESATHSISKLSGYVARELN